MLKDKTPQQSGGRELVIVINRLTRSLSGKVDAPPSCVRVVRAGRNPTEGDPLVSLSNLYPLHLIITLKRVAREISC